jgi:hypothetical protein
MQIGVIGLGCMDGNVSRRLWRSSAMKNISMAITATSSRAAGHNGNGYEARSCDLDNCLRQPTKGTKQNLGALKDEGASDRRTLHRATSRISVVIVILSLFCRGPVPTAPSCSMTMSGSLTS